MSRTIELSGNPNLDDALRFAKQLGCSVRMKHANGEVEIRHPNWPTIVAVNSRRKSTPRVFLSRLRRLLPKDAT